MLQRFVLALTLVIGLGAPAAPQDLRSGRLDLDLQGQFRIVKGNVSQPAFIRGVYDTGIGPYDTADAWDAALFLPSTDIRGTRGLGTIPINMYLNYHRGADDVQQIRALMDALGSSPDHPDRNVMWLQTTNCFAGTSYLSLPFSTEVLPGFIDGIKDHPQLAGYYIMDECDDSLIPETRAHHALLLGADPASKTFAVPIAYPNRDPAPWTQPSTEGPTASFFATDPYVIYGSDKGLGYPHFLVADEIARLRDRVSASDPIVAVLQFFKFGGGGRLPTYDEMRHHAYSAIVEGVQGLFWWEVGVNGLRASTTKTADIARMMGYLEKLVQELAGLEPALLASAETSSATIVCCNPTPTTDWTPLSWRLAAVQRDMDLVKRASYAAVVWYDDERKALLRGDISLSPMLHSAHALRFGAQNVQKHDVRYRASVVNGFGYLIAYNYSNLSYPSVTFQWSGTPSAIERVGDRANAPTLGPGSDTASRQFSDSFGPYQVRIYRLNP